MKIDKTACFEYYRDKNGLSQEVLLPMGSVEARVTAVHKERYELLLQDGREVWARLKASIFFGRDEPPLFPTVGDYVGVLENQAGDGVIVTTLPRGSFFSRRDPTPGRGEQAVAANFEWVFLISSLNQDFNPKRLERYLTQAWQSGGEPVVVLTKEDLCPDPQSHVSLVQAMAPGVPVYPVSAKTGHGMERLAPYLKAGETGVLLGSSGVGKSSLVNALAGRDEMQVKGIREEDGRGRHTTTHRQMVVLPSGFQLIDTPGMRELGMWDVTVGLGEAFGEVEELFAGCRFSDCTHQTEPGCAVRAALEAGSLSPERWERYGKLQREAQYSAGRPQYLQATKASARRAAKTRRQKGR